MDESVIDFEWIEGGGQDEETPMKVEKGMNLLRLNFVLEGLSKIEKERM